jgi:23S rRNA (cytosine1962-C5)-methyltransferase
MITTRLKLKSGNERRVRGGHLWIYSNEVDVATTPLKTLEAGCVVTVEDHRGQFIGMATINPASLICARIYSRIPDQQLNLDFLKTKFEQLVNHRDALYPNHSYRLCFGDADFLPGLVIDRFGEYLSVQLTTAAMDQRRDIVVQALLDVLAPTGILFRNKGPFRIMEGLPEAVEVAYGDIPVTAELVENNTRFAAPLLDGQKTGWFYDHRENRALLQRMCKDQSVLDVYSYIGGWGIEALMAGASSATCVDASQDALEMAHQNAELNGIADKFTTYQGKANDVLKQLAAEGKKYDIVVLDPPAFIKRKKDIKQGEKAYHQINQLAMRVLNPGGLLVSASCSMHLAHDSLMDVVRLAGSKTGRQLQVIADGGQGLDHPQHPAIPETNYLKAVFAREVL